MAMCALRAVIVEGVLGTCAKTQDCPGALNGTKGLCCWSLTSLAQLACQDLDTGYPAPPFAPPAWFLWPLLRLLCLQACVDACIGCMEL